MSEPDRWLHLRHPEGFSDAQLALFQAHCRIWRAYTEAVLAEWATLEPGGGPAPRYVFFEPTREGDTVTLPVGGEQTLASRAMFEDAASHLLSDFFPLRFRLGLEEGLTETLDRTRGPRTSWRRVLRTA